MGFRAGSIVAGGRSYRVSAPLGDAVGEPDGGAGPDQPRAGLLRACGTGL